MFIFPFYNNSNFHINILESCIPELVYKCPPTAHLAKFSLNPVTGVMWLPFVPTLKLHADNHPITQGV